MKEKLDVVIIATIRADILRMTLATFHKNFLRNFDARAIINVDPLGDAKNNTQMDMVNICKEYFTDVKYRAPKTASFAGAVKWCWRQVETDLFFHLEDDWILTKKMSKDELQPLFDDEFVVGMTLNKGKKSDVLPWIPRVHKTEVVFYNEQYIHCPELYLNPSMFRTAYIKELVMRLDGALDPEARFKATDSRATKKYPTPVLLWRIDNKPLIIDIGNVWRKHKLIHKSLGGNKTTQWLLKADRPYFRIASRAIRYYARKWWWQVRYCQ